MTTRTYADKVATVRDMLAAQQSVIRDLLVPEDFEKRVIKGFRCLTRVDNECLVKSDDRDDPSPRLWYGDGPKFARLLSPKYEIDIVHLNDPVKVAETFDEIIEGLRILLGATKYQYVFEVGTYIKYEGFHMVVIAWVSGFGSGEKIKPPSLMPPGLEI